MVPSQYAWVPWVLVVAFESWTLTCVLVVASWLELLDTQVRQTLVDLHVFVYVCTCVYGTMPVLCVMSVHCVFGSYVLLLCEVVCTHACMVGTTVYLVEQHVSSNRDILFVLVLLL